MLMLTGLERIHPARPVHVDFLDRMPAAAVQEFHRERMRAAAGLKAADPYQAVTRTVLATEGQRVVGGLRLIVREPWCEWKLPMERCCEGLSLPKLFPELPLDAEAHGELIPILGAGYDEEVTERLWGFLCESYRAMAGLKYVFSVAGASKQRMHRRLAQQHDVRCAERPLPDAPEPRWFLPRDPLTVQAYVFER